MAGKTEIPYNFSEIVKKAYEKGTSDNAITVQQLIEDLKIDLMKIRVY